MIETIYLNKGHMAPHNHYSNIKTVKPLDTSASIKFTSMSPLQRYVFIKMEEMQYCNNS